MKNGKNRSLPVIIAMVFMLMTAFALGLFTGGDIGSVKFSTDKLNGSADSKTADSSAAEEKSQTVTDDDSSVEIEMKSVPENQDDGYDTADIYAKAIESVVCVNVYTGESVSASASGTGIIMTSDGYIVTNAHVIDGASYVNVVMNDGSEMRASVVGADSQTDLAVLKVSASDLTAAEIGDSSQLKIGERAVVIGNAGGLSGSCTTGVISGLDRDVDSSRRALTLIQTSAAINPGNSGGPLLNRFGQVIGITSSKIASVDYEGIGFAIPTASAVPVIESIIANGYVTGRAKLGISVIELNTSNGPDNGLIDHGAYIAAIDSTSGVARAGVREGDVIIEANGTRITTVDDLLAEVDRCSPGDIMKLGIYRPETEETFYANVLLGESK